VPAAVYAHGFARDEPLLRLSGDAASPAALAAHYAQDAIGSMDAVIFAGNAANQARQPGTALVTAGDFSSATYPGSQLVDGSSAPSGGPGWVGVVANGAAATLSLAAAQPIERVELSAVVNYRPGAYVVELLQGANWVQVASGTEADFAAQPDGSVRATRSFPAQATSGVRVRFTGSINSGLVWLTEVEAWSAGASAVVQRFDAWGDVAAGSGSVPTYGHAGREPDASGRVQMRARYYAPGYGQFISRDPLGLAAGINPYAYAEGNPLRFNDPDGLLAQRAGNFVRDYGGDIADVGVGFTPAGLWADLYGAATGRTLFGGQELSGWERVLGLIPGVSELNSLRRGVNAVEGVADAARGGAQAVRVGQAGEDAVRAANDIGPKVIIDVAGRTRIPDGLTPTVLSEVKNVQSLSYTQQLRD
jgi:RHS repeat-associated protein